MLSGPSEISGFTSMGGLIGLGPSLLDFLELGSDHRDYGIHDRVGVPAASGLFCP